MSAWLINDATPESLGLEIVGGAFRSGAASTVELRAVRDFDAAEIFPYGETVVIKRDGAVFFRGTVRAVPKDASDAGEGQACVVEDAWADLERTIYQEPWGNGPSGTVLMPRVFLGVDSAGNRIRLDQQISEVLAFANAAGVDLQAGSIPSNGMLLWPQEVDGMSCAEVIRTSLRYHPDWIPWFDHSTSPPTFHVTPRASAETLALAVTDCAEFHVAEMPDRLPDAVRICYVTASTVSDEVYRNIAIDKYPTDGPDSGPGVLAITVDLQGSDTQIQKQQVQTRTIPEDETTAKAYLKAKYPALADVPDAAFDVEDWTREVIPESEDPPEPVNPLAERLVGTTFTHLPRELVRGNIAEWMRRRVGKVRLTWTVTPTNTATEEEVKKIEAIPQGVTITATNAVTKIYKGIASYEAGEDAPAGIAQSYYDTIRNGCRHEGSATLLTSDLTGRWHGRKLNLTGGPSAWSTMAAPIHSIRWDAETEVAAVDFGPNPEYSAHDYVEYLRLLRKREVTWISMAERTSNELGDELGASARGDNIGPFDVPEDVPESPSGTRLNLPAAGSFTVEASVPSVAIAASYWRDGIEGALTTLDSTTGTGDRAYLKIAQQESGDLTTSDPVTYLITDAEKPAYELNNVANPSADPPYWVEFSYVPLGHIEGSGESARWVQERNGNFLIEAAQLGGGYVGLWTETILGSVPPPPAPP